MTRQELADYLYFTCYDGKHLVGMIDALNDSVVVHVYTRLGFWRKAPKLSVIASSVERAVLDVARRLKRQGEARKVAYVHARCWMWRDD